MSTPNVDDVFDALRAAFPNRDRGTGLVQVRRAGDEAILMFRWPPAVQLFGVPVSLARIDRRLDWDRPARDLEEWLESVGLWIMEDVENGYLYRARRRAVDDYIELSEPTWPMDERFYLQVNQRIEKDSMLPHSLAERGLDAHIALAAQDRGTLLVWTFAYENNSTGSPVVGHSTVVHDSLDVARLVDLTVGDDVPATVAVDLVRSATHAAVEAGSRVVVTDLDLDTWHPDLFRIAGFRPGQEGMSVATDFLAEDAEFADRLLRNALATPGRWGHDRDRSGRYLPKSHTGRFIHRLRYGESGKSPRVYAG